MDCISYGCPECNTALWNIKDRGNITHYCPVCKRYWIIKEVDSKDVKNKKGNRQGTLL